MGVLGAFLSILKACFPRHYEYNRLSAKSSQTLRIQWFERQELPGITDCLLCLPRMRHPQRSTTCRAKPGRAKRGSAVTRPSEARCLGRAKRGVTPSLARAAKQARMRFNCRDSTAASKRPWSAGKRALHERDSYTGDVTDGFEESTFPSTFIVSFFKNVL